MPNTKANGRHRADDAIILALVSGATVAEAAEKAGISESTVYSRLRNPAFKLRLDDARNQIVAQSMAILTTAAVEASTTLRDLLAGDSPPTVRLNAARAIHELGIGLRKETSFHERLAAIERKMGMRPTDGAESSPNDESSGYGGTDRKAGSVDSEQEQ